MCQMIIYRSEQMEGGRGRRWITEYVFSLLLYILVTGSSPPVDCCCCCRCWPSGASTPMMSSSSSRGPRWTPASRPGRGRLDSSRWRSRAPSVETSTRSTRWARRPYGRPRLAWWTASPWSAQSPPGGCRRWRRTMRGWARTAGEAVILQAVTPPTSQTRRKSGVEEEEEGELWQDPGTRATHHLAGRSGQPDSVLPRLRATDTLVVLGVGLLHPRPTGHLHSRHLTGTTVQPVTPRHTENPRQLQAAAEHTQPRPHQAGRGWEGGRPLIPVRPWWGRPTTLHLLNTGRGEATRGPRQPGTSLVTTQESPPPLHEDSPGCGRPDTPASLHTR